MMGKHLWFREKLCTSCSDCEAACIFTHLPDDWQVRVKADKDDKAKASRILGREATADEADKFAAVRRSLSRKEKLAAPSLIHLVDNHILSCRHCDNAKCLNICPSGAIKRNAEGIIASEPEKCIGCRSCFAACTIGMPQFMADGKMMKCDLCQTRLQAGQEPACVAVCQEKALLFKDLKGVYAPKPEGNEAVGLGIRELWHNPVKEPEYMLRLRGNGGGYWTADQLDVIAKWADRLVSTPEYKAGYLDITLRQDIELHHLSFRDEKEKEEFLADLAENQIYLGTFGPLFRSIVSCIGGSCPKARRDAKELGHKLYLALNKAGFNLPKLKGKIKVGISGCLEGCGHMRMYDITVAAASLKEKEGEPVGRKSGDEVFYRVFLGGNMGRYPQPGIQIAQMKSDEEVIDFILKAAEFFKDYCELGNIHRLSYWIRVKYGRTGDPFIFSASGITAFLEDFTAWVKRSYGELGWLSCFEVEKEIPESVRAFCRYHQEKLSPMDIYEREDVFPHLTVKGDE